MNRNYINPASATMSLLFTMLWLAAAGCQCSGNHPAASALTTGGAQIEAGPQDQPGEGQMSFSSDKQAAATLLAAIKSQNHQQLRLIFGPDIKELASGDKVEDHRHFEEFVTHAKQNFQLQKQNATTSILLIGKKDWPFPIPLIRQPDGRWFFDTAAGKDEILDRRIGGDELEAINVCRMYVTAQRKYFSTTHDGSSVRQYARRLASKAGEHDGLYWPAGSGEPQSPFSALAAQAQAAGYTPGAHKGPRPFFGYYFHILTKQGPAAPGGAMNYVTNGHMTSGFGLVAFPDKYGASGVMTFIVNKQGQVYQKNLGPQTVAIAGKLNSYNPDGSWTLVK